MPTTYNERDSYDIAIPGIQDIIRIPALEDKQLKLERYLRMKNHYGGVPEQIGWIPHLINRLDNAQDLLITALNLGLPLFRYLGPRIVPWVGWALLANDLLNIATGLLAVPLTGKPMKAQLLEQLKRGLGGRLARAAAAERFLKTGSPWLPFTLQAGQVLADWTGYGLQLGTVMGAASDTFWTLVKHKPWGEWRIQGPPPSDAVHKAVNYMLDTPMFGYIADVGDTRDVSIDLLAQAAGQQIIRNELGDVVNIETRNDVRDHPVILHQPWSPSTLEILAETNTPVAADRVPGVRGLSSPTFGDWFHVGQGEHLEFEKQLANLMPQTDAGYALSVLAQDAALDNWNYYGGNDVITKIWTPFERMLGIACERHWMPRFLVPDPDRPPTWELLGSETWNLSECSVRFIDQGGHPDPHGRPWFGPEIKLTPAYPPPSDDYRTKILWWIKYAMIIWCRVEIDWPVYELGPEASPPWPIIDWKRRAPKWGTDAPLRACLLVFGNAWQRPCPFDHRGAIVHPAPPKCWLGADHLPNLVQPGEDPPKWQYDFPIRRPTTPR